MTTINNYTRPVTTTATATTAATTTGSTASTAGTPTPQVPDVQQKTAQQNGSLTLPGKETKQASSPSLDQLQAQIAQLVQSEVGASPDQFASINEQIVNLQQEEQQTLQGNVTPSPSPSPAPAPTPATSTPSPAPAPATSTPSPAPAPATSTPSPTPGVAPAPSTPGKNDLPPQARADTTLNPKCSPPIAQWSNEINGASKATGVPADLLGAVMYQESSGKGDVNATTNGGTGLSDSGLMQVDSATQQQMMQKYPDNFKGLSGNAENVMAGACYLKDMHDKFGSWSAAERGYNSGPGSVDPNDPTKTTTGLGDPSYVTKVNAWWTAISTGQQLPTSYNPADVKGADTGNAAPAPSPNGATPTPAPAPTPATPTPAPAPTPATPTPAPTPATPTPAPAPSPSTGSTGTPTGIPQAKTGGLDPSAPGVLQKYASQINSASQKSGVPANLIAAVVMQESGGSAGALTANPVSGLPDGGLMQIDSATYAKQIQPNHPDLPPAPTSPSDTANTLANPDVNILAGAYFLSDLQKKHSSDPDPWGSALREYNSGAVPDPNDLSKIPPPNPGSTDPNYVTKIERMWNLMNAGQGQQFG